MSIARVSFYKRFKDAEITGVLVNTVHDSIVVDCIESDVQKVASLFHSIFDDLPANFSRLFAVPFSLPLKCEVSVGPNMKELKEIVLTN